MRKRCACPERSSGTSRSVSGSVSTRTSRIGEIFKTTRHPRVDDLFMPTNPTTPVSLVPRLVVDDPDAAAEFYEVALGAKIGGRFTMPDGTVTNIDLTIGDAPLSLTTEVVDWGLVSPQSSSPVLFRLTVSDARRASDRMLDAGARQLVPVEDRPYGRCEGRLQDPFGHLWIVSHVTEELTDDQIRARLAQAYGES